MELDDLKEQWKRSTENIKPSNNNIMQLIQNKSTGPLEKLKQRFKKPMVLLPLVVSMLIINLSRRHDIFSDGLFWFYIGICLVVISYFFYSYRMVSKMQVMDEMVKANLEKQVQTLENSIKKRIVFIRVMAVLFIVLMEILMYYQQEPSFAKWYAQPLLLRLSCYIFLVVLFYFFTRSVKNKRYTKLITNLKELVSQMQ
ncbi:MAG: hypothetical protein ABIQ31_06210 [Ferruginibacter sp.]